VRAWRDRDVAKKRAPHRLLLRIGPARLEDLGEAVSRGAVQLADHGPHVRHGIAPPLGTSPRLISITTGRAHLKDPPAGASKCVPISRKYEFDTAAAFALSPNAAQIGISF
jgi:hypothetical protein